MIFKRKSDFLIVALVYGVGFLLFMGSGRVVRFREAVAPLTVSELTHSAAPPVTDEAGPGLPAYVLLGTPSHDERVTHFSSRHSGWDRFQARWGILRIRMGGRDPLLTQSDAVLPVAYSLDGTLAGAYVATRDFESARAVLRKAIRLQAPGSVRNYLCGELAWLEDDPAMATTLLEQSLSEGPGTPEDNRWPFLNALELATTTENPDLSEYYWDRFPDAQDFSIDQFQRNNRRLHPWLKLRRLEALIQEAMSDAEYGVQIARDGGQHGERQAYLHRDMPSATPTL